MCKKCGALLGVVQPVAPHRQWEWTLSPAERRYVPTWQGSVREHTGHRVVCFGEPQTAATRLSCRKCGRTTQPVTGRAIRRRARIVDWNEDRFAGIEVAV